MNRNEIIKSLDQEIIRLRHVKELLEGTQNLSPAISKLVSNGQPHRQRNMSPEGRRRIAEAQKRRWAKQKRSK